MACHLKNRASNYRVILNQKLDYEGTLSNSTLRQSARLPSASLPQSNATASPNFKSGALKAVHLDRAILNRALPAKQKHEVVALPVENSAAKQQMKNEKKKHHTIGNKCNDGERQRWRRRYAYKRPATHTMLAPCDYTTTTNARVSDSGDNLEPNHDGSSTSTATSRKLGSCYEMKTQPVLLPKGQTGQKSRSVRERMKHSRLNGADLYVVRMGRKATSPTGNSDACCAESHSNVDTGIPTRPLTASLHDELINPRVETKTTTSTSSSLSEKRPSVLESRPCYRCISYMASVGIKRVFWSTNSGDWEGAKVRDIVDALDKLGLEQPSEATADLTSVFVTKHEVLMLRRLMGNA
ncbi:Nn.00g087910.m01.CDS01 [Neocucurbitaria sp. VM-36]